MIKSGDALRKWFLNLCPFYGVKQRWREGVCVTSAVRRDVLTDDRQGKIILKGAVRRIQFKNLGGGVYRAYIEAAEAGKDGG